MVFFIPLYGKFMAVPNIIMGILIPFFFIVLDINRLKKSLLSKVFLSFVLLVSYTTLVIVFNGSLKEDSDILERYGLIILFFILSSAIKDLRYLMYPLIFSVMIMAVYTFTLSGIHILEHKGFDIDKGSAIKALLISERLYTGFFSALSFLFSLSLLSNKNHKIRNFHYFNLFLTLSFVLLISSRMALIIIIVLLIFYFLKFSKNVKTLYGVGLGLMFVAFTFALNPNLSNRFFHLNRSKGLVENFKNWEPRLVIWDCASNIVKDKEFNSFFGFGSVEKTNEKLTECYATNIDKKGRRAYFLKVRFNTHNQYLTFLLSFGALGLIFFLLILITSLMPIRKSFLNNGLTSAILLFCLIESFLERQTGGYIFAFFLTITFMTHQHKTLELGKRNKFK